MSNPHRNWHALALMLWLLVWMVGLAGPVAGSGIKVGSLGHFAYPGESGSGFCSEAQKDAQAYKVLTAPRSSALPVNAVAPISSAGGEIRHLVKKGDTIWKIARGYGIDPAQIVAVNKLANPDLLTCGQELLIPGSAALRSQASQPNRGSPAIPGKSLFVWPLQGRLTSPFGWRKGEYHHGIDIAAPTGTAIQAARDGLVLSSQWDGVYGRAVVLRHSDGTKTRYAHASKLLVTPGQTVLAGQTIAKVGSSGRSTGPHLHFEIIVKDLPKNPLIYLP